MITLLTARTIMLGRRGEIVRDGAVLLDGATVAAVGSRHDLEADLAGPDPAVVVRRLDLGEATVLPGLVDAHVHLVFGGDEADPDGDAAGSPAGRAPDHDACVARMSRRAGELLRSGVTTVRDLGDRDRLSLRVRDAIATGETVGPRVLAATSPLTPPDGHCHYLGGVVRDEAGIRERIADHAEAGADVIKVMASGGQTTDGPYAMWDPQFSTEALGVVVEEAHARGLRVAAHAHASESIAAAVDAGVDTVEHATWLAPGREIDRRDEVARRMAERGVVFCHASSNDWRGLATRRGERWAREMVGRLAWFDAHGVTQICGTDAGIGPFGGTARALTRFAEYGFAADHIVEIGTSAGAEALGLAGTTGSIAPGLAADLLVVDGDVTTDVEALCRPRLVVAGGRFHDAAATGRA